MVGCWFWVVVVVSLMVGWLVCLLAGCRFFVLFCNFVVVVIVVVIDNGAISDHQCVRV